MSSLSLQRFDKDGIELVINTQTGESFATISGYARMAKKDKSTISRRVASFPLKTAEIPTQKGIQSVALLDEDTIAEWIPKDNPTLSSQLLKLGIRGFMHKLAGFEIVSNAVSQTVPTDPLLASIEAIAAVRRNQLEFEARLAALEKQQKEAEEELASLPLASEAPADIPTRGKINLIVRNKAQRDQIAFNALWSNLYTALYYRYQYDVKARCRNSGLKPLDQIEKDGMMEKLHAIASEVLV